MSHGWAVLGAAISAFQLLSRQGMTFFLEIHKEMALPGDASCAGAVLGVPAVLLGAEVLCWAGRLNTWAGFSLPHLLQGSFHSPGMELAPSPHWCEGKDVIISTGV